MIVFHIDIHTHNDVYEVWIEDNGKFWLMEYLFKPTKMKILNDLKETNNLINPNHYEISRLRPIWDAYVAKQKTIS